MKKGKLKGNELLVKYIQPVQKIIKIYAKLHQSNECF